MSNSVTRRFQPWEAGVDLIATGKQLRKFRLLHHFTQERLSEVICEECDYSASKNAISTWETGKKLPSLHHAVFLSELYGCRIDQLVISYRRSRESAERDQLVPLLIKMCNQTNVRICVHSSFFVTHWCGDYFRWNSYNYGITQQTHSRQCLRSCGFVRFLVDLWHHLRTLSGGFCHEKNSRSP